MKQGNKVANVAFQLEEVDINQDFIEDGDNIETVVEQDDHAVECKIYQTLKNNLRLCGQTGTISLFLLDT